MSRPSAACAIARRQPRPDTRSGHVVDAATDLPSQITATVRTKVALLSVLTTRPLSVDDVDAVLQQTVLDELLASRCPR